MNTLLEPHLRTDVPSGVEPDSPAGQMASEALLAEQQHTAATLYRHAPLGLGVTAFLAVATMLALDLGYPDRAGWEWLGVFLGVIALRSIEALRQRKAVLPPPA